MRARCLALAILVAGCFPDAEKLRKGGTPGAGGTSGSGMGGTGGMGGTAMGGAGGTAMGGAGGSAPDGGPPGPSRTQACTELGNALSAQIARCNPFLLMAVYGSQQAYAARLTLNCNLFDAPGVNWPARPFKPCADAMAAQPCADWVDDVPLAACPLNGQFLVGQPCGSGFQCESGLCSFPATGCGRCIGRPAQGQPCMEACGAGLECNPAKVCAPQGARGATCNANTPCKPSLACHLGVCTPPATSGPCMIDDECDLTMGYACNPDRGCVKISFGPMCQQNTDGSYVYCMGNVCKAGACIARAADGAACSDTDRLFCQWPARCVTPAMRCQLPAPDKTCMPAALADPSPLLPSGRGRISDARAFARPGRLEPR